MSATDKSMSGLMTQGAVGTGGAAGTAMQGAAGKDKKGAVNLSINLDPDLLAKLGLGLGSDGSLQNLNESMNNNAGNNGGNNGGGMDDFFVDDDKPNSTGGRGNVDEMFTETRNPN